MSYSYDRSQYSYDRTATTIRPEVAFRVEGGVAVVSLLVDDLLAAYHKTISGDPESELLGLKSRLEEISGTDKEVVWDKASDLLEREGFKFSTRFDDRDPGLSKKRYERQQEGRQTKAKELGKWLRGYVVKFVEETYAAYKRGGTSRKEPCVTASYFRMMLADGGAGLDDGFGEFRELFKELVPSKQIAACQYALEAARKSGKINASTGIGHGGRETRCYEPLRW